MGRQIEVKVHSDAQIRRREVDDAERARARRPHRPRRQIRRLIGADVAQRNEPRAIREALESLPAEPMQRREGDIKRPEGSRSTRAADGIDPGPDPRPPMPDPAPPIPPGPEVPDPLPPPPDPAPV